MRKLINKNGHYVWVESEQPNQEAEKKVAKKPRAKNKKVTPKNKEADEL